MDKICYSDIGIMQNQNTQPNLVISDEVRHSQASRELRRNAPQQSSRTNPNIELFGSQDRKVVDVRGDEAEIYFTPPVKPAVDNDLNPEKVKSLFLDLDERGPVAVAAYQTPEQVRKPWKSRAMDRMRTMFRKTEIPEDQQAPAAEKQRNTFARKAVAGVLAVAAVAGGIGMSMRGGDGDAQKQQEAAPSEQTHNTIAAISPEAPITIGGTTETPGAAATPAASEVQQPVYDSTDTPWSVLQEAGVPADQIAPTISQAMNVAEANGADVQEHGSGQNLYYSVDGDSSTAAVMSHISQ